MDVKQILGQIADSVAHEELVFPTTTEMALNVQRAIDDPNSSVEKLAKLVQAEPLLAAKVVAIANSVVYNRSGREITDIKSAVSLLGFKTLRSLATSIVVRQMESMVQTAEHRKMAIRIWEHTAHVAALANIIARRVTHLDPDMAFFAGIVHEVGGFFLISRASAFPGLLEGEEGSLEGWDDGAEAVIGRAVLQRLGVPEIVQQAIEGMWDGYLTMPPRTLADTLLLADLLAPLESPLSRLAGKAEQDTNARIEVVFDAETLSSILAESAADVESLIGALNA